MKAVSRKTTGGEKGRSRRALLAAPSLRPLTAKQVKFVELLVANPVPDQAYREAGFHAKDAKKASRRLMKDRSIMIAILQRYDADKLRRQRAKDVVDPAVQAGETIVDFTMTMAGKLDTAALATELRKVCTKVRASNLDSGMEMLALQAQTLSAIFHRLARAAAAAEYVMLQESLLKVAFRAQSQCRATWEAISTIQNPPLAGYVRQANVSHGHQIVNNTETVTHARGEKAPTKLLEPTTNEADKWLDRRAPQTAGRADSQVATVVELNGTEDRQRQG